MSDNTAEERSGLLTGGREFSPKKSKESYSVAAYVREMAVRSQQRGKQRPRGRPRRGMPRVLNEKKILGDLKKELGLG